MKALILKDQLQLREIANPQARDNQALIRVSVAGICNTDLEIVKGYMGFHGVLGHEFVGIVQEAPTAEWVGARVCGEINLGCGSCDYCLKGLSRHCPNRTVLGILNHPGAFAEYLTLPLVNLHRIPETIPDRTAVFVEPLAAALEILEQLHIQPDWSVAVIGDGKLGLLICQVLKLTGCDLVLIGKHARKCALAEKWGVPARLVGDLTDEKFDVVVEASGSASGFATAMQVVRPRGTIVLKSTYHGHLEMDAAPIVINEIRILGSRCGPFDAAIRVLANQQVEVESLVEATYPFEQALKAFEHAREKGTLKILLNIGNSR
ncbi:MAG: alcohol dehydrogenase catalytic domain-containing protein [bacterium]